MRAEQIVNKGELTLPRPSATGYPPISLKFSTPGTETHGGVLYMSTDPAAAGCGEAIV